MIQTAENIILSKEYYELSAEELATVSDLVQNAEEFDEMKWFLASTQQAVVADQIEATPALRKSVLDHLNQPEKKRKFWLNGVIPFLLPEDKKFFQKPAFQLSMVAVLVVGFILFFPKGMEDNNMALNSVEHGDHEGKILPNGSSEGGAAAQSENDVVSTIVIEEDGETTTRDEVITDFMPLDEIEESEELAHDGFYSGPLTDRDLKRIENANSKDDLDKVSDDDMNAFGNVVNQNNNTNGSGIGSTTINAPIIAPSETNELKDFDQNISTNSTTNIGNKVVLSGKDNLKKSKISDPRLKPSNDATVVYESIEKPDVDDNLNSGGSFDIKPGKEEKITLENLREKEYREVQPRALHIDETKELKKFYTVFK